MSTTAITVFYRATLIGANITEDVNFPLEIPGALFALAAAPATSTQVVRAVLELGMPHLTAAAPRFTCNCGKRAKLFMSNTGSWLHVPPPDGPFIFNTALAVCVLRGPCDLAARERGAKMSRDLGLQDRYSGGAALVALRG